PELELFAPVPVVGVRITDGSGGLEHRRRHEKRRGRSDLDDRVGQSRRRTCADGRYGTGARDQPGDLHDRPVHNDDRHAHRDAAMVQTTAARAAQRFPKDASLQVLLAQNYRKAGQMQQQLAAARRATEIDPKNANAWLFAIVTANDLNMPDTAMALAQKAIAA